MYKFELCILLFILALDEELTAPKPKLLLRKLVIIKAPKYM